MEINPVITSTLKEHNINVSLGTLCLLAVYHKLDPEVVCSEEIIKSINVTKIVTIDYTAKPYTVKWLIPLYGGEETDFSWVRDWASAFEKLNPHRVVDTGACISRMKEFFSKFPQYRKDHVYMARNNYFKTVKDSTYLKHAHKFIKEGTGKDTVSLLLGYCKQLDTTQTISHQKGKIL